MPGSIGKRRQTYFYLVTSDPHTNEIIAETLASANEAAGNDDIFIDNEGIQRKGWRVTYQMLNDFLKAQRKDKRLIFVPFVKEGVSAPREWKLIRTKKPSKNLKAAKKRLDEIVEKRKKVQLLLVTGDEASDKAVLAYLKNICLFPENISFIDDGGNSQNGWVVEFEITNFPYVLLSDKNFKITPFIDDGVGLPRKWKLIGNRKKAATNIRTVQERPS